MRQLQIVNGKIVAMGTDMGTGEGIYTIANPDNLPLDISKSYDYAIAGDTVTLLGIRRGIAVIAKEWQAYADYKQARKQMQDAVTQAGFEHLTLEEQRIAAKWFATSEANVNSVLTFDEQLAARPFYNEHSRKSRMRRWYMVFELFELSLSVGDAMKVIGSIKQHDLEYMYTVLGFEGKGVFNYKGVEDQPSILDFLNSTAGTKYETAGLLQLGLTPALLTVEELISRATNIITNGE